MLCLLLEACSQTAHTSNNDRAGAPGAWLVIRSEMDSRFVLDAAHASIDGEPISGAVRAPLTVGRHELAVDLTFHFESGCTYCYARAWTFVLHDKHTFEVAGGADVELDVIAYEKGGLTTPVEERPALRFVVAARSR